MCGLPTLGQDVPPVHKHLLSNIIVGGNVCLRMNSGSHKIEAPNIEETFILVYFFAKKILLNMNNH